MRRLGIVTEHHAVDDARAQVLAMLEERSGPFANAAAWTSWRWDAAWLAPAAPAAVGHDGGCTSRGLKRWLDGCLQQGIEGCTEDGHPSNRIPAVPADQPPGQAIRRQQWRSAPPVRPVRAAERRAADRRTLAVWAYEQWASQLPGLYGGEAVQVGGEPGQGLVGRHVLLQEAQSPANAGAVVV
ncbi:hypothetical protein ACQEVY_00725 [Streptomyces sp. CA-288835]|uniref:hypothetical protein n=1 Tax=Streptomyces sp. CA-288835 TaxID=3240069 RepID=UPI003D93249B